MESMRANRKIGRTVTVAVGKGEGPDATNIIRPVEEADRKELNDPF
jgi:hypothetical protein